MINLEVMIYYPAMELQLEEKLKKFKELLDNEYEWPCLYLFKFIIAKKYLLMANEIFSNFQFKIKESANGNYISLNVEVIVDSSDEVLTIYEIASKIPKIISL